MVDSDARSLVAANYSGQVILVMRNLLKQRYPGVGKHVNRVARLCETIAPEVGLPEDELEALVEAASLHDIGKLSLPESLLAKPVPLTEDEWTLMRQHTVIGEQILLAAGLRGNVLDFVRSSHERIDGAGYPAGLVREEIPLGARIIAVCDAYDAMTSPRPYRPIPMSIGGASLELLRGSGTQFDAAAADALCDLVLHESHPIWHGRRA